MGFALLCGIQFHTLYILLAMPFFTLNKFVVFSLVFNFALDFYQKIAFQDPINVSPLFN